MGEPLDPSAKDAGDWFDELPLWSAPFGLRVLDHVPLRRGDTVLDVGAGTGFLSIELAQRLGPSSRVIAVDPWAAAAARLRRKLARHALDRVEVWEQDASALPLPDACVDTVVCSLGLNNFADPTAVLATCARVARPGATLVVATNPVGHFAELYEAMVGLVDPATLDAHVAHRGTAASVTAALDVAGFVVTTVDEGSTRLRFADSEALIDHAFVRLAFLPSWRALLPAERDFAELRRRLDRRAVEDGALSLSVPVLCLVAERR